MVILHRLTNTSAALKTWKKAPLFYLLFVFTIMHGSRRTVRNGEVLISFTTSGHKVDVRGRGWYSNMYAWNQVLTGHDSTTLMSGLQDCGRVLEGIIQWVTSVVEPLSSTSSLCLPDIIHMMNETRPSLFYTALHYCECKLLFTPRREMLLWPEVCCFSCTNEQLKCIPGVLRNGSIVLYEMERLW